MNRRARRTAAAKGADPAAGELSFALAPNDPRIALAEEKLSALQAAMHVFVRVLPEVALVSASEERRKMFLAFGEMLGVVQSLKVVASVVPSSKGVP